MIRTVESNNSSIMPRHQPIKWVKQKTLTDCGVACVAMVTGRQYYDIKQLAIDLKIFKRKYVYYTKAEHLIELISHHSINVGKQVECSNWNDVPEFCVAAINKVRTRWHWVVVKGNNVYDPNHGIKPISPSRDLLSSIIPIYERTKSRNDQARPR